MASYIYYTYKQKQTALSTEGSTGPADTERGMRRCARPSKEKVLRRAGRSRRKKDAAAAAAADTGAQPPRIWPGVTAHTFNPRAHRQRLVGLFEFQASQGCTDHSLTDHTANKKE